jgi:hypothetical protein
MGRSSEDGEEEKFNVVIGGFRSLLTAASQNQWSIRGLDLGDLRSGEGTMGL